MPDAMETIFQSALALGRHGGVSILLNRISLCLKFDSYFVIIMHLIFVYSILSFLLISWKLTSTREYEGASLLN